MDLMAQHVIVFFIFHLKWKALAQTKEMKSVANNFYIADLELILRSVCTPVPQLLNGFFLLLQLTQTFSF